MNIKRVLLSFMVVLTITVTSPLLAAASMYRDVCPPVPDNTIDPPKGSRLVTTLFGYGDLIFPCSGGVVDTKRPTGEVFVRGQSIPELYSASDPIADFTGRVRYNSLISNTPTFSITREEPTKPCGHPEIGRAEIIEVVGNTSIAGQSSSIFGERWVVANPQNSFADYGMIHNCCYISCLNMCFSSFIAVNMYFLQNCS